MSFTASLTAVCSTSALWNNFECISPRNQYDVYGKSFENITSCPIGEQTCPETMLTDNKHNRTISTNCILNKLSLTGFIFIFSTLSTQSTNGVILFKMHSFSSRHKILQNAVQNNESTVTVRWDFWLNTFNQDGELADVEMWNSKFKNMK